MPRLHVLLAVAVGGALGALARYGLTSAFPVRTGGFDWAVFGINVSGCFAIGVIAILLGESRRANPLLRPFLTTGLLGGFTTFSSYVVGMQRNMVDGAPRTALLYGAASLVAGLTGAAAGLAGARALLRSGREGAA